MNKVAIGLRLGIFGVRIALLCVGIGLLVATVSASPPAPVVASRLNAVRDWLQVPARFGWADGVVCEEPDYRSPCRPGMARLGRSPNTPESRCRH